MFNGDPHAGNILLLPDGRLGLIDYGQVKYLTEKERLHLCKVMICMVSSAHTILHCGDSSSVLKMRVC